MERYNPSHVIAPDATAAYQTVRCELERLDYGFSKDRELLSVELVAEDYEYTETGSRLFLPNVEVCDGGRKTSELKQDANRHSQH